MQWRLLRPSKEGQELLEYAIVVPILLLLSIGIIELGIVVLSYDTIANAAREGARYGIVHPSDTAGMEAVTRNRAPALDQGVLQVIPTQGAETVRVEVEYDVDLLSGVFVAAFGHNPTVHLRAVATMQREQ